MREGKTEEREVKKREEKVQVTERKESCKREERQRERGWSHLISQRRKVIIDRCFFLIAFVLLKCSFFLIFS